LPEMNAVGRAAHLHLELARFEDALHAFVREHEFAEGHLQPDGNFLAGPDRNLLKGLELPDGRGNGTDHVAHIKLHHLFAVTRSAILDLDLGDDPLSFGPDTAVAVFVLGVAQTVAETP